jgi:flavin-dependent dehydrogenase
VRTDTGERIDADLVVDAAGRRSQLPGWLSMLGTRAPLEQVEDSGFVYYARHFRRRDGGRPAFLAGPIQEHESISLLTLPADNDTWSVAFVASSADRALRPLRQPDRWSAALSRYPLAAHWADGTPITGVDVMAKIEDRIRRFVVDEIPIVTGVLAVGDSWACTNPSLGRGSSIGLLHACALRDLLREVGPDQPEKLVRRWDESTAASVTPLYEQTVAYGRHRLGELEAERNGHDYRTDDPVWRIVKAMQFAQLHDPDVLRAHLDVAALLATPGETLARPGVLDRLVELGADTPAHPLPGPSRAELVATLGEAA